MKKTSQMLIDYLSAKHFQAQLPYLGDVTKDLVCGAKGCTEKRPNNFLMVEKQEVSETKKGINQALSSLPIVHSWQRSLPL